MPDQKTNATTPGNTGLPPLPETPVTPVTPEPTAPVVGTTQELAKSVVPATPAVDVSNQSVDQVQSDLNNLETTVKDQTPPAQGPVTI